MEFNLAGLSDQLAAAVRGAAAYAAAVDARHRFSSSGIVWRPGVVVTADHAVKREEEIKVTLPDGSVSPGRLAGRDRGTDLAVLRVENTVAAPPPPATGFEAGALALAVGRSVTTGVNATLGIVSAVAPGWRTWRGGRVDRYIRLDLTLYPGLSGAAVIDASGRLIGMATSALSRLAGVAVPCSTIDRVVDELLTRGRVARPYIGVGLQPVRIPEHLSKKANLERGEGLIVLSLEPDGPGERAGLLVGDILAGLGTQSVYDTDDVQAALEGHQPGGTIQAVLLRGGERRELAITLGEVPGRPD